MNFCGLITTTVVVTWSRIASKTLSNMLHSPDRFLIWGSKGWIAGHLEALLHRQNHDVHATDVRMDNQAEVCRVLDEVKPTHVINCAGKTGRPNVDWCEDHKLETIESNVTGTLILVKACHDRNIHITVMATGCKL